MREYRTRMPTTTSSCSMLRSILRSGARFEAGDGANAHRAPARPGGGRGRRGALRRAARPSGGAAEMDEHVFSPAGRPSMPALLELSGSPAPKAAA